MNSTVKTVLIVGGIAALAYVGYRVYKAYYPSTATQPVTTPTIKPNVTQQQTGGIAGAIDDVGKVADSLDSALGSITGLFGNHDKGGKV